MKFKSYSLGRSSIVYQLLIILGFAFLFTACEWGDQIESLAQPNADDFAVLQTDTLTIQLSTIGSDSVMTGAPSRMVVGAFRDPYFGRVKAVPFFQPVMSSSVAIATVAEYDSVILSMKYDSTYSYGDTTKPMTVTVHKLLRDILERNSYWNQNSTAYDPAVLGKITFLPRPRTADVLRIKLSDVLGKQLFQMAQNSQLTVEADFINVLKGLVIMPTAVDNGSVVGFQRLVDKSSLQLHYHTPQVSEYKKDSAVFRVVGAYHQILSDYTGTQLSKLPSNKRLSLPSAQTGNMVFMQAGMGTMIRIDLPTLRNFKYSEYTAMNKAILRLKPLRASVSNALRVPPTLYVYRADKNNQFYTDGNGAPLPLYMLGGTVPVRSRYIRDLINNREYYEFDISSFVTEIMTSETGDVGGLIIRSSQFNANSPFRDDGTEFAMSVDRLVIGDQKNADKGVELDIYYTRVNAK